MRIKCSPHIQVGVYLLFSQEDKDKDENEDEEEARVLREER